LITGAGGVGVNVIVGVSVMVGVRLGMRVRVGMRVVVAVRVLVGLGPKVGVALEVGVEELVGVEEGVGVSVRVGVAVSGASEGVGCGVSVGGMMISSVGTSVGVGARPTRALNPQPASKSSASGARHADRMRYRLPNRWCELCSLFDVKSIYPPGPLAVWAGKIIAQ